MHVYEVRPRKDKRGVDLISDALPFGRLWCGEPNAISNAIGYAQLPRWFWIPCVLAITRRSLPWHAQAMEGEAEKLQLLFRYLDGS
jgi:hypothetical protein